MCWGRYGSSATSHTQRRTCSTYHFVALLILEDGERYPEILSCWVVVCSGYLLFFFSRILCITFVSSLRTYTLIISDAREVVIGAIIIYTNPLRTYNCKCFMSQGFICYWGSTEAQRASKSLPADWDSVSDMVYHVFLNVVARYGILFLSTHHHHHHLIYSPEFNTIL